MIMNKQQLKQIIKEELSGVLKEMGPDLGDLPQSGEEMDQALNPSMPSDIDDIEAQISNLYDSIQGLDAHGVYSDGTMHKAAQEHLHSLMQMVADLKRDLGK